MKDTSQIVDSESATEAGEPTMRAMKPLWRLAMFGLLCHSMWGCYEKWADKRIATATETRHSRFQQPFSVSMCTMDYKMEPVTIVNCHCNKSVTSSYSSLILGTSLPNS